jgi:hypothetical protein
LTPWLECTVWVDTFAGTDRRVLQTLMQLPDRWTKEHGLFLVDDDLQVWSPAVAERLIYRAVCVVDVMFDRCKETVR